MREITLVDTVRSFERTTPTSLLLRNTGVLLFGGSLVSVGGPVTMVYDHRAQVAIPYDFYGKTGFLLESEVARSIAVAESVN